jgi:hypothetical protein
MMTQLSPQEVEKVAALAPESESNSSVDMNEVPMWQSAMEHQPINEQHIGAMNVSEGLD